MNTRDAIAGQLALMRGWRMIAPPELARDRALEIMLELAESRYAMRRVSVGKFAFSVPLPSRLRWLGMMEAHGWVAIWHEQHQAHRTWVRITDDGLAVVESLFAAGMKAVA